MWAGLWLSKRLLAGGNHSPAMRLRPVSGGVAVVLAMTRPSLVKRQRVSGMWNNCRLLDYRAPGQSGERQSVAEGWSRAGAEKGLRGGGESTESSDGEALVFIQIAATPPEMHFTM